MRLLRVGFYDKMCGEFLCELPELVPIFHRILAQSSCRRVVQVLFGRRLYLQSLEDRQQPTLALNM